MRELEDELRADGARWREQVDGLRPEPAPPRTRSRAWIGALVAAALVVTLAVVLALRIDKSPGGQVAAGADHATPTQRILGGPMSIGAPRHGPGPYHPRAHVPQQATCPTSGGTSAGSGFAVSLAEGDPGSSSPRAAAAKYPPKHVHWTIAARDARSALLLYRAHYLHVVRLPGGGWAVDSGGSCGGAEATVAR